MASISPTTLSNGAEPYTGKNAYTKLHITAIRQSDGATNKTYIDWKITVEGTPWTTLYRLYCTLGGKVLYDGKPALTDWRAGNVVASGTNVEFSNNSDGSLSLYAYIKQQFYYGNGDSSRWTNSYYYQEAGTTMTCSQIPRYCTITSFTVSQNDETSVKGNWAVDANVSVAHCRHREKGTSAWSGWNQVAWPNFTYGGLSAGKTYEFQLKVKRQDSGLETESGVVQQSTFNYPYVTSTPDFTIGNTLTIGIHNPIKRNCTFYLIGNNGEEIGGAQTTGTTMSGYTAQEVQDLLYRGIPNARSGRYSVRLVVSDIGRNTTTLGGTYYIKGTETPTFNDGYITEVIDTLHVADITGNSSKFIKGHNVLTGKITPMNPRNSANGSRYVISANANPSSQEITHENGVTKSFTLRNITTNYFSITAYDSRELPTAATENISLVDYSNPVVRDLLINRTDGVGEYATLSASGTFTHWSGWNEIKKYNSIQKVYYRYREASSSSWYGWYDITNKLKQNANGSWSLEYTMDIAFTNTSKYVFEIYVQDLLESSNVKSGTLSTANAFIWRDLKNKRMGINKKPENFTLDVGGSIGQNGNQVLDVSNLNKHAQGDNDLNVMVNRREVGKLTNVDLNTYRCPGVYGLYGQLVNGPTCDEYYETNGYHTLTVEAYSGSHLFQTLKISTWSGEIHAIYVRSGRDDGSGGIAFGGWRKLQMVNTQGIGGFYMQRDVYGNAFTEGGKNYLLIRTPIKTQTYSFNRVKIEGYAYRNQTPIHVEVCWYNYLSGNTWMCINMGWFGVGPTEVKVCQHADSAGDYIWLQLLFPTDHYFTRFIVTEFSTTIETNMTNQIWASSISETEGNYTGNKYTVPRRT